MFKRFICILSLMFVLPVFAGEFENALISNNKVLLYMYTPECGYCKDFNQIYQKLEAQQKSKYKFIKVDANTPYGNTLMRDFGARYVPYVVLVNSRTRTSKPVLPECIMNWACVNSALKNF